MEKIYFTVLNARVFNTERVGSQHVVTAKCDTMNNAAYPNLSQK